MSVNRSEHVFSSGVVGRVSWRRCRRVQHQNHGEADAGPPPNLGSRPCGLRVGTQPGVWDRSLQREFVLAWWAQPGAIPCWGVHSCAGRSQDEHRAAPTGRAMQEYTHVHAHLYTCTHLHRRAHTHTCTHACAHEVAGARVSQCCACVCIALCPWQPFPAHLWSLQGLAWLPLHGVALPPHVRMFLLFGWWCVAGCGVLGAVV